MKRNRNCIIDAFWQALFGSALLLAILRGFLRMPPSFFQRFPNHLSSVIMWFVYGCLFLTVILVGLFYWRAWQYWRASRFPRAD